MKTEELIEKLAGDAAVVRPLPPAPRLAASWAIGAMAVVVLLNAVAFHCRGDLARIWLEPRWLTSLCALIGIVGFGAQTAFQSGFPGRVGGPFSRNAYRVCLLLFVATLLWPLHRLPFGAGGQAGKSVAGLACSRILLCLSVIPALLVLLSLRRLAPLAPQRTARVAGTAAAAIGAFGLSLDCSVLSPTHFVLYHALPLLAFAWLTGLWGARLLRW